MPGHDCCSIISVSGIWVTGTTWRQHNDDDNDDDDGDDEDDNGNNATFDLDNVDNVFLR